MARESWVVLWQLLIYALWVLVPLIPAVLIYRLFPKSAVNVKGPMSGLSIKAGGAFAAYLVIFAASYAPIQVSRNHMLAFNRQVWTVHANVKLVDAEGKNLNAELLLRKITVSTEPNPHTVKSAILRLTLVEENGFPLITVQIPNFGAKTIDLRSTSAMAVDYYQKVIDLKEPIVVREELPRALTPDTLYEARADDRFR